MELTSNFELTRDAYGWSEPCGQQLKSMDKSLTITKFQAMVKQWFDPWGGSYRLPSTRKGIDLREGRSGFFHYLIGAQRWLLSLQNKGEYCILIIKLQISKNLILSYRRLTGNPDWKILLPVVMHDANYALRKRL